MIKYRQIKEFITVTRDHDIDLYKIYDDNISYTGRPISYIVKDVMAVFKVS